jgi:hypothetical protein
MFLLEYADTWAARLLAALPQGGWQTYRVCPARHGPIATHVAQGTIREACARPRQKAAPGLEYHTTMMHPDSPRQKSEDGATLGARSGFVLSLLYTIFMVLWSATTALVDMMLNRYPWAEYTLDDVLSFAIFGLGGHLLLSVLIGVLPLALLGAFAGAFIDLIHRRLGPDLTQRRSLLVGVGFGVTIVALLHYTIWPAGFYGQSFVDRVIDYLLFPGFPSLLLLAASTWVSWKLYKESLSTLQAPPPRLPNDNRNS